MCLPHLYDSDQPSNRSEKCFCLTNRPSPTGQRQERRHLGAHHASTGIFYHGKIIQGITFERSWETGYEYQCEEVKKATDDLINSPKYTVPSMVGLTSPVWTLGMFQMVTGESYHCIQHTKQTDPYHVGVRHVEYTVPHLYEVILKLVKKIQSWGDTQE